MFQRPEREASMGPARRASRRPRCAIAYGVGQYSFNGAGSPSEPEACQSNPPHSSSSLQWGRLDERAGGRKNQRRDMVPGCFNGAGSTSEPEVYAVHKGPAGGLAASMGPARRASRRKALSALARGRSCFNGAGSTSEPEGDTSDTRRHRGQLQWGRLDERAGGPTRS